MVSMALHNSNSASWIVFYFFLFTNKRDEGLTGDCKSVYVLKTLCNYKNRVPKVIAPLLSLLISTFVQGTYAGQIISIFLTRDTEINELN